MGLSAAKRIQGLPATIGLERRAPVMRCKGRTLVCSAPRLQSLFFWHAPHEKHKTWSKGTLLAAVFSFRLCRLSLMALDTPHPPPLPSISDAPHPLQDQFRATRACRCGSTGADYQKYMETRGRVKFLEKWTEWVSRDRLSGNCSSKTLFDEYTD